MNSFETELKKIVESKQLVEVRFNNDDGFKVAYILGVNGDFLTLGLISDAAIFDGVFVYRMSDVSSIKVDTNYLSALSKQIDGDTQYQLAIKNINQIEDFTFGGFISKFADTKTIVEVECEDDRVYAGRIVGYNDKALIMDEYHADSERSFARVYIYQPNIVKISVDSHWLRTISLYLEDKNL